MSKGRYVKAECPHCKTVQLIDAQELCRKQPVFLGPQRLSVTCTNPECRRTFTIELDCTEYQP